MPELRRFPDFEIAWVRLRADEAIAWATRDRNTTKRGPIPGGLGLKLLREFVELNRGRIQIVSDDGYWASFRWGIRKCELPDPFPGTVVSLQIDTSDKHSYVLSSEAPETEILEGLQLTEKLNYLCTKL